MTRRLPHHQIHDQLKPEFPKFKTYDVAPRPRSTRAFCVARAGSREARADGRLWSVRPFLTWLPLLPWRLVVHQGPQARVCLRRLFEPLHEDIESFRAQSDDLAFGGTAEFSEIVCRTVDGSFCTVCVVARVCHGVSSLCAGRPESRNRQYGTCGLAMQPLLRHGAILRNGTIRL